MITNLFQDGDSDDEIAELRYEALLTKKENEAEVSSAHEPASMKPVQNVTVNQPLQYQTHHGHHGNNQFSHPPPQNNYSYHRGNYRGRRGPYRQKQYLNTFSQVQVK